MPGNALLRRLGIDRPSVIERATEAADSGFWLALRVAPEVTSYELRGFLNLWAGADLAPITDVVVPSAFRKFDTSTDEQFTWLTDVHSLADGLGRNPVIPAAAKGAEGMCRQLSEHVVALDEALPEGFTDPCFYSRPERDKSFVRCARALLRAIAEDRVDRVVLWTHTAKVLGACRTAAHGDGADLTGRFELCVSNTEDRLAERLLAEGETVRVWFSVDRIAIDRAVAR